MRFTLVGNTDPEEINDEENEENLDGEDFPEEGLLEADVVRTTSAEMNREVELMLLRAMNNGLPEAFHAKVFELLENYRGVFRIDLGMDPPARGFSKVFELLKNYRGVFRIELGMDPPDRVLPLKIEPIDGLSPERRGGCPRIFALLQRQFIDEHLQSLLRIGVIKCSTNEAAPIVLARKQYNRWRMCIDLRSINSKTKGHWWLSHRIKTILLPYLLGF